MTARAPRTTDGSRLRRWCALALVVSSVSLQAQSGIRIVPLVRDGSVLISFSVSEAYTSDVKAVIQSGLRTTFTYTVEKHEIVSPLDVEIIDPVGYERIVLTACHPLYSAAQRYAVFARVSEIDTFAVGGEGRWPPL